MRQEREQLLESIRRRGEEHRAELHTTHDWLSEPFPELQPTCGEVAREYGVKEARIADPIAAVSEGVLLLLPGTPGADWVTAGRVNRIFDNLIAQRRVTPLLVLMPSSIRMSHRRRDRS